MISQPAHRPLHRSPYITEQVSSAMTEALVASYHQTVAMDNIHMANNSVVMSLLTPVPRPELVYL